MLFLSLGSKDNTDSQGVSGSYNPPKEEVVDQERTLSSGSRSPYCSTVWEENSIVLLTPNSESVHYTLKNNPTFYFYARKHSSIALNFDLVNLEDKSGDPLYSKKIVVRQPNIIEVNLPSQINLANDVTYIWQISVPCEEDTSKTAKVVRATVKKPGRIEKKFLSSLSRATSDTKRAKILAENGYWYDAIALAKVSSIEYFQQLLHEAKINLS